MQLTPKACYMVTAGQTFCLDLIINDNLIQSIPMAPYHFTLLTAPDLETIRGLWTRSIENLVKDGPAIASTIQMIATVLKYLYSVSPLKEEMDSLKNCKEQIDE